MSNLEKFINDTTLSDYDPLVKMAMNDIVMQKKQTYTFGCFVSA